MAVDSGELSKSHCGEEYFIRDWLRDDADCIPYAFGKSKVAILIPAYNEELTIGSVVLQALNHADQVLVVNDGSIDRTASIARAAGATVIEHPNNSGKAAALRTGFAELKKLDYEIIVMMDGDGQHEVDDIDSLIAPLLKHDADLVIGSRFMKKDNSIPLYRQIGQRVLNRITNIGSSKKMSDTQSGFRAFNRLALEHMNFPSEGYAIEQDMIVHCSGMGLRIKEVPIAVRYDVPNGHKQGSLKMGMGLLNNIVTTIGYKRPLILFGIPGLVLTTIGIITGLLTTVDLFFLGDWMLQSLISGFMVVVGSTLAVAALSLNSLSQLMRMNRSNQI